MGQLKFNINFIGKLDNPQFLMSIYMILFILNRISINFSQSFTLWYNLATIIQQKHDEGGT